MQWQAFHEPIRRTLVRTGLIGVVVGLVAVRVQRQPESWPRWIVFGLWLSFGGHWVEIFFLNWLRPRLAATRWVQVAGRLCTWLVGGTVLLVGARVTLLAAGPAAIRLPPWWLGGPIFVAVELLVHVLPQLRRQPNFYNGLR